jgi:transcriptional regulator
MYVPSTFNATDPAVLHKHMRSYGFATLITHGRDGMTGTHLPIFFESDSGPHGRLLGHVARANRQWKDVKGEALVIFPGPHAYVSASWYEMPGTVPTWNYTTVHVYGAFRLIEDPDAVHDILQKLVAVYEGSMPHPWSYDSADPAFGQMLREIVGFEIEITRLQGKYKLNQNHPAERRERVIRALQEMPDDDSQAIATMMAAMLTGL